MKAYTLSALADKLSVSRQTVKNRTKKGDLQTFLVPDAPSMTKRVYTADIEVRKDGKRVQNVVLNKDNTGYPVEFEARTGSGRGTFEYGSHIYFIPKEYEILTS